MNDTEFLQSFEACTLPITEWTHRAHLKVAYLYLRESSFDVALKKIRCAIQRYNAATNTPEALNRGYHETITQAWARLIHFTMAQTIFTGTADEFLEANPQLLTTASLRFFYSHERIMSWQAKGEFVEPDLTPFPVVAN